MIRFLCPKCKLPLEPVAVDGKITLYRCESNHCYDAAAAGYVNLNDPGKKNNALTGDSRESVAARSRFLSRGYYGRIADAVVAAVAGFVSTRGLIIDAGCGEGYYTNRVGAKTGAETVGLDASKHAVGHAAKSAGAAGLANVSYAAANIFAMPLDDGCADCVMSLFAPLPEAECARVLSGGGGIVMAIPAPRHLFELKAAVYDRAYENDPRLPVIACAALSSSERVDYSVTLSGNDAVRELFSMTPYRYKTSPENAARLDALCRLEVTVSVDVLTYRRV